MDYLNPLSWFGVIKLSENDIIIWTFFLFIAACFVVILLGQRRKNSQAMIMNYESESLVTFMNRKVKDGSIMIGKKQIHVDNVKPITVKMGGLLKAHRPLYVIKWNLALPLHHTKSGTKVVTGENLKHLIENKTLEQLLKPKGADKAALLYIILGVVIGIMAGYIIAGMMHKP